MHWKYSCVTLMFASLVPLGAKFATADEEGVHARVSRVKDGNTFVAQTESHETRIYQLLAAVAPLKMFGQPGWRDAEERLQELIEGKPILLRTHAIGGQTYAIVDQGEDNINRRMIQEGYAWFQPEHIRGGPYAGAEDRLAQAQQHARKIRAGIWSAAAAPVEPWKYETFLREEAERVLLADGPPWSIAPKTTGALAVVQDMASFSNQLDQVARSIDLPAPEVLDHAIRISRFDKGLNRHGSLMWWFDPVTSAETYAIPAFGGQALIGPRLGRYEPYMSGIIEGESYQAVALKNYALFGQNEPWLKQCAESEGGLEAELSELTPFLVRQDIALAARGSVAGLPFDRLPFSKGDGVISNALQSTGRAIQQFVPGFTESTAFAAGTELLPPKGARVSLAAGVDKASVAAKWPESMTCNRKTLLGPLPDLSPGLVLALSSCDAWNEALKGLFDDPIGPPIELVDLRGLTLMLSPYADPKADNLLAALRADVHVENADESLQTLKRYLEKFFQKVNQSSRFQFKLATVDQEGRPVLEVTITSARKGDLPEPLTLSIAAVDNSRLIVQGGTREQLQDAIANPAGRPRLVDSELVKPTMALLDDDAQQLLLLDLPNVNRLVSQILERFYPDGKSWIAAFFKVDEFQKIPPIGVSGQFAPSIIELRVAAPTATLKYLANSKTARSYYQWIPLLLYWARTGETF